MDWIEKIFGISPDNEDGSTEAMMATVACLIIWAIAVAASPNLRAGALRHLDNLVARLRR
jgi:hypothetical protein